MVDKERDSSNLPKSQIKKEELLLTDCLQQLIAQTEKEKEISIEEIVYFLSHKGNPAVILVLSLPFCFPIPPPGLSTFFGSILAFLGLRHAFAKNPWWPEWVLKKKLSSEKVRKIAIASMNFAKKIKRFLHPRLLFLTMYPLAHCIHGLTIFLLSLFLALPIPIPLSNILSAAPIVLIAIGILENDGLALLLGYFFTILAIVIFFYIFYLGSMALS